MGNNKELYKVWPELMLLQTRHKSGQYTCGGDSGTPGWFEKNGEWIYIGAAGSGMGPECSSAPDDPLWTDQFWSVNAGDQFDTAQAYPEVIEAANKFLAEQVILEEKIVAELKAKQELEVRIAAELKAKQEAEAKAAAELRAKQEAEAKAAAELKAKQEAEAIAALELRAKEEAEAKAVAEKLAATKAASLKKTTITCIKGKLVKKVTAVKPVCPKGYKKK